MKTIKTDFYSIIQTEEHTLKALDLAAKYKKKRRDVKFALANPDWVVTQIRAIIRDGHYVFKPTKMKFVSKRVLKKDRWIVVPPFIKHVFHHVIMLAIRDDFISTMYRYSVGSIPERGIIDGLFFLRREIRTKFRDKPFYCLKMDVKKFFETIPINKLKAKLAKRYRDKKFLKQIDKILDDNMFIQDQEICYLTGIPIGFYTSQWFANWYLSDLDHYIKNELRAPSYLRYVDDMVILDTDKNNLHRIRKAIEAFLEKEGLKLKENYQVFKVCDYNEKDKLVTYRFIDVLGFKFYHNKVTLRSCVFLGAKRKALQIYKKKGKLTYKDASSIMSYLGYFKYVKCEYALYKYITSLVNVKACKKVVSIHAKKMNKQQKALLEIVELLNMEVA